MSLVASRTWTKDSNLFLSGRDMTVEAREEGEGNETRHSRFLRGVVVLNPDPTTPILKGIAPVYVPLTLT